MKIIIIGITDHPKPFFPPEVMAVINSGRVFSGGRRHHEKVAPLLPADSEWIDITAPVDDVFERYQTHPSLQSGTPLVVFASGDPLFFGFANTVKRKMSDAEIVLYPAFHSLQTLAHRLVMPYHDMRIVSLTGRPWPEFDRALIERAAKIGILTDRQHTPAAIAQRMLEYGYADYTMHVGEHLGNPEKEKVTMLTLAEAARQTFDNPNCLIVTSPSAKKTATVPSPSGEARPAVSPFGIPDSAFALLNGREKMITKMPIRLLTLQALELPKRHVLWDIGACTGSISIEARLLFPHLQIHAFEIRPECESIIQENARRHGAPGINLHIGDFVSLCCDSIPPPDAVFIGGHGGRLKEIMAKVTDCMTTDCCLVFNSVSSPVVTQMTDRPSSRQLWDEACRELALQQMPPLKIQLNDFNPIEILKAHRPL